MKKLNCVLLVNSETPENFLNYRLIKKMDICQEICIERNAAMALDFIENYRRQNNGILPELIIFEYRTAGDLLFLEYMRHFELEKTFLMMFHLHTIQPANTTAAFSKSGYITRTDISSMLHQKMSKVA